MSVEAVVRRLSTLTVLYSTLLYSTPEPKPVRKAKLSFPYGSLMEAKGHGGASRGDARPQRVLTPRPRLLARRLVCGL